MNKELDEEEFWRKVLDCFEWSTTNVSRFAGSIVFVDRLKDVVMNKRWRGWEETSNENLARLTKENGLLRQKISALETGTALVEIGELRQRIVSLQGDLEKEVRKRVKMNGILMNIKAELETDGQGRLIENILDLLDNYEGIVMEELEAANLEQVRDMSTPKPVVDVVNVEGRNGGMGHPATSAKVSAFHVEETRYATKRKVGVHEDLTTKLKTVKLSEPWTEDGGGSASFGDGASSSTAVETSPGSAAGSPLLERETDSAMEQSAEDSLPTFEEMRFKEVTDACLGLDEEIRAETLQTLSTDPNIAELLPKTIPFISYEILASLEERNLNKLVLLLRLTASILANKEDCLKLHVEKLIPSIRTCILILDLQGKSQQGVWEGWEVREMGSKLLAQICSRCQSPSFNTEIERKLLRCLLNEEGVSLGTLHGAIADLGGFGREVGVKADILPRPMTSGTAMAMQMNGSTAIEDDELTAPINLMVEVKGKNQRSGGQQVEASLPTMF